MEVCPLPLITEVALVSAIPRSETGHWQRSDTFCLLFQRGRKQEEGSCWFRNPWSQYSPVSTNEHTMYIVAQSPWQKLLSGSKWYTYSFTDQHVRNFRAHRAEVCVPALTGVFYASLLLYWFCWLKTISDSVGLFHWKGMTDFLILWWNCVKVYQNYLIDCVIYCPRIFFSARILASWSPSTEREISRFLTLAVCLCPVCQMSHKHKHFLTSLNWGFFFFKFVFQTLSIKIITKLFAECNEH